MTTSCMVLWYNKKAHTNKHENLSKNVGDVGMAVPQSTQTRCMDGTVQATQRTTQITPSLHLSFCVTKLSYEMTGNSFVRMTIMKDVGMGLLV